MTIFYNPDNVWVQMPRWKKRLNGFVCYAVMAFVAVWHPEAADAFKARMLEHCRSRLSAYKTPVRVRFTDGELYSARFKRSRSAAHATK